MPLGRRIVCWRSDTACELNIIQPVYWSPQVAKMAVNALCIACLVDETRSSESKVGLESNHRSTPRLRAKQLSSRSFMRPCVAKSG
jgi:hypothetical protein